MTFSRTGREGRVLDLDLTPMIDVVFLLLIFFMTTTQFARMSRAEIDLPQEPGEREQSLAEPGEVVINVTRSGEIIVDERSLTHDQLLRMVAADMKSIGGDAASIRLTIRAHRGAPASIVNRIAADLARIGVRDWRLATEVPARNGGSTS